jgi:hypothetical protein
MKTYKYWECWKAWQEEGRKCRPNNDNYEFDKPSVHYGHGEYILEPQKSDLFEWEGTITFYELECALRHPQLKRFVGKKVRVIVEEIL